METPALIPHYFQQHVLQEGQFGEELNFKLNGVEKLPQGMCLASPPSLSSPTSPQQQSNFSGNKTLAFLQEN